jgi:hypothetical protein
MGWLIEKYGTEEPQKQPEKSEDSFVASLGKLPLAMVEPLTHPEYLVQPVTKSLGGKTTREVITKTVFDAMDKEASQTGYANWWSNFATSYLAGMAGEAADIATTPLSYVPIPVGKLSSKIAIGKSNLAEIASKVPVGKGFVQGVKQLAGKEIAPVVEQAIKSPSIKTTQEFVENINLTKFPEDVRGRVAEIVKAKPEIGKTPKISDEVLFQKAQELKGTPTINYLSNLPEGTVESEALKLRQGNTQMIRDALKQDLSTMKDGLDGLIEDGLAKQRKVSSMFGRGLRQQSIPAETQQEMAFLIDDKIKAIRKDPIFSQDTELINTMQKLRDTVVSKEFNPTIWNKAYSVWMNSILSSPMTHLVNTSSNTLFALAKIPEKFASALFDLPLSVVTGKRTQYFGEIPAMLKGLASKEKLPPELIPSGSKIDVFSQPIRGTVGKVVSTPSNLLQLEDNLAKNTIGRMELWGQRYAGKTGEELLNAVKEEQLYRTFQNEPTALARGLLQLRSKVPALRYVIPFIKTPANLIERGLERTPLVLGKILYKGATKAYTQAELAKDLGLLSLGSTLAGWVAWQHSKGNITGNAPENPAEKDAFYRQGKKPNAVKVGDHWVPLDRLEPVGSAFSVISNLIQDYKNSSKDLPSERVLDAVGGLAKTLTNKTYLSGMTNFVKAMNDPEMYGASWMRRMASGSVPNVLSFLAQLKDPYYREANSVLDYMKAKIPFVSETLPPKINAFGEPVARDVLNIGTENKSQLEKAIADTPIGFPSKKLGDIKLSPDEYRDLVIRTGKKIKPILENLSRNPKFLSLPVELRDKIIENVVSRIRMAERKKMRIEREIHSLYQTQGEKVIREETEKENRIKKEIMTNFSSRNRGGKFKSEFMKKYGQ